MLMIWRPAFLSGGGAGGFDKPGMELALLRGVCIHDNHIVGEELEGVSKKV